MHNFQPTDHLRHAADGSGRMRDSLFWQTTLPEQRLCFQAYLFLTASDKAGYNLVLWGDGEKPVAAEFAMDDIKPGAQLDHFEFAGLTLDQESFGGPSRLRFEGKRMAFDFTFTGRCDPFSYHDNPDGLPSWFARDRYEQAGWLTGHISAKGEKISLDGMGHHDHSWGNRNWGMPQHWKWFAAYTPDGSRMINGWIWVARGEWGCAGFVVRDGRQLAIRSIRQHARYDGDMSQRSLRAEIIDVEGGSCVVELERFGLVKLPTRDKLGTLIQEAGCTAIIDGLAGAGQYETHWQQGYLDHLIETGCTQ